MLHFAVVPLSLLAAGPFTDLNPGRDAANADIQAIADAGITRGCNPPDFTAYCPNDLVTREQMASFLARTAGLGGNAPVANAQTAGSATTAATAQNAQQLATDTTVRQSVSPSCYDLAVGTPVATDGALALRLRISFAGSSGGGQVTLYAARLTLVP